MLRIGLTGGIGAGKSTVARRLVELGASLVDADAIARAVVAPGTEGLAEVVAEFGPDILDADGALDRPALARIVFADASARDRLNGIVHPLVRQRTERLIARAPDDAVVVQDIPLLVEGAMAAAFPLVVVVDAAVSERVRRLVRDRGMSAEDAHARIAAQASEQDRRAAADVWLDNSGEQRELLARVDRLWHERLVPFEANLRTGRVADTGAAVLVEPNPDWVAQYRRVSARIALASGVTEDEVRHIGSTAVPGLLGRDVIDVRLTVPERLSNDRVAELLRGCGLVRLDGAGLLGSADPGRPVRAYPRRAGSAPWRADLLLRDWLRASAPARQDYADVKRRAAATGEASRYAEATSAWRLAATDSAERWASSVGWSMANAGQSASTPNPSEQKV